MAVRIRRQGLILCAEMHPAFPGDTYLDDETHYYLSVTKKVLVTEPMDQHKKHGQWWWSGSVPTGKAIDPFYLPHQPQSQ